MITSVWQSELSQENSIRYIISAKRFQTLVLSTLIEKNFIYEISITGQTEKELTWIVDPLGLRAKDECLSTTLGQEGVVLNVKNNKNWNKCKFLKRKNITNCLECVRGGTW
jgi:hypothetical protein